MKDELVFWKTDLQILIGVLAVLFVDLNVYQRTLVKVVCSVVLEVCTGVLKVYQKTLEKVCSDVLEVCSVVPEVCSDVLKVCSDVLIVCSDVLKAGDEESVAKVAEWLDDQTSGLAGRLNLK